MDTVPLCINKEKKMITMSDLKVNMLKFIYTLESNFYKNSPKKKQQNTLFFFGLISILVTFYYQKPGCLRSFRIAEGGWG